MFGSKSCSPIMSLAQDYFELKTTKDQKTETVTFPQLPKKFL